MYIQVRCFPSCVQVRWLEGWGIFLLMLAGTCQYWGHATTLANMFKFSFEIVFLILTLVTQSLYLRPHHSLWYKPPSLRSLHQYFDNPNYIHTSVMSLRPAVLWRCSWCYSYANTYILTFFIFFILIFYTVDVSPFCIWICNLNLVKISRPVNSANTHKFVLKLTL